LVDPGDHVIDMTYRAPSYLALAALELAALALAPDQHVRTLVERQPGSGPGEPLMRRLPLAPHDPRRWRRRR